MPDETQVLDQPVEQAEAEQQPDVAAELEALRAQYQRERAEREQLSAEQAQLRSRLAETSTVLELRELDARAPDPLTDPEAAVRYWREAAFQERQRAEQQARQQEQARQTSNRTDQFIADELAKFKSETGLTILPNDERLLYVRGSWKVGTEAFRKSLDLIRREEAIKKQAKQETLREAGITRMDGGSTGGSVERTDFTLAEIDRMTPEEYEKHKPAIMRRYYAGEFDRRRRTA